MENSEIIYRLATKEDIEVLAQNTNTIAWETEQIECDLEFIKSNLDIGLDYPENIFYFVAERKSDNQVIASLGNTMEYNIIDGGSYAWFQSVCVQKEHRGKKIFRNLFEAAKKLALETNCLGMKLYVEKENHRARAIYKKYGFYFPDCSIYQIDLVFGFGCDTFSSENIQKNNKNFKEKISKYLENLENLDSKKLDLKLEILETDELIDECLGQSQNIDEFEILFTTESKFSQKKKFSEKLIEFKKRKFSDCFCLKNGSEVVGLISTFDEFSDWRGGFNYWVYDFRISKEVKFAKELVVAKTAELLLDTIRKRQRLSGNTIRWQIFNQYLPNVLEILEKIGFEKYGDDVMNLDFS